MAEQHESEKQLMARQAEMQRQQYEGQLKKVGALVAPGACSGKLQEGQAGNASDILLHTGAAL